MASYWHITLLLVVLACGPSVWAITPQAKKVSGRNGGPCRALALGGGGDRGAFQVGAIQALVDHVPDNIHWQVVTGISAGSINAATVSMFKIGDEHSASDFLLHQWHSITKEDVYCDWPGGIAQGFLFKSGLFDTTPLRGYLKDRLDYDKLRQSGRKLIVGASSLSKGKYEVFYGEDDDILDGVMASSAVPGVFPNIHVRGEAYVDGGVEYMTPISDAVAKCKEVAEDVTVDVILCIGFYVPEEHGDYTTLTSLLRSGELLAQNILTKDLQDAQVAFPDVQFRLIYPSVWLPGYFLGFGSEDKEFMIQQGYKDAVAVLEREKAHGGRLPLSDQLGQ
eukprot:TRINITY_DN22986_c0_g2_i1.p1 TRINITY_DN22986_c0_g2~~TRINITY_DN22986_c0_g2_i1.p1  ORF type:complete len:336 (+),score=81.67 TRINITY_DN22986_c0_g2_i1:3-1010(+)